VWIRLLIINIMDLNKQGGRMYTRFNGMRSVQRLGGDSELLVSKKGGEFGTN
jgi:hypothetical protein